jgi:hypothetical protein
MRAAARRTSASDSDSIGGARSDTYQSENPAQGERHGVLCNVMGQANVGRLFSTLSGTKREGSHAGPALVDQEWFGEAYHSRGRP